MNSAPSFDEGVKHEVKSDVQIERFLSHSIENDIPPPLPPHGILSTSDNNSQKDYRPPVPPHRNVGVSTAPKIPEIIFPPKRYHHHKHHRNSGHYQNKKTNGNVKDDLSSKSEEHDHIMHNWNGNEPQAQSLDLCQNASFDLQASNAKVEAMREELHMAEKLVENAALQQKTAFQFDTLTPKAKKCDDDDEPTRDDCASDNKWKPHLRGAKSLSGKVFPIRFMSDQYLKFVTFFVRKNRKKFQKFPK